MPNVLKTSLISYWKLDEASGTRNDSHGSNHLTDNNTVGSTTGIISNGANFITANSEYLSRASNASLQMSGNTNFTISAWVNMTSNADYSFVAKDDDASNSRDFNLGFTTGGGLGILFHIQSAGVLYVASSAIGSTSTWYHLIAWYDSSNGQCHLRINDATTYNSSTGATGADASSAEFRIGAREYAGFESYMGGIIDEVGLWKRKLTSQEMTDLYNGGSGLPYSSFGSVATPNQFLQFF